MSRGFLARRRAASITRPKQPGIFPETWGPEQAWEASIAGQISGVVLELEETWRDLRLGPEVRATRRLEIRALGNSPAGMHQTRVERKWFGSSRIMLILVQNGS